MHREERFGEKGRFGWAQSGTLRQKGNAAVTMQTKFPENDVYSVQFSVIPKDTPTSPLQSIATLLWSVAGNHIQRQISIGTGTTISATAEAVSVKVVDASVLSKTKVDYDVTIAVSRGVRAPVQQPPILDLLPSTGSMWNVDPGSGLAVPVPPNVGAISVAVQVASILSPDTLPDGAALVYQQLDGTVFKGYDPRSFGPFVPLIANCDQLFLVNQTNSLALTPQTLSFSVQLGIDG